MLTSERLVYSMLLGLSLLSGRNVCMDIYSHTFHTYVSMCMYAYMNMHMLIVNIDIDTHRYI